MVVPLVKVQRRRSRTWWGVFFFALLTINAYVLFDILDLDGSQMTGWPADDVIVAEALQVEADRFSRADPFTPDSTSFICLWMVQSSSTDSRDISPVVAILGAWQHRMPPRVTLHREMARTSSSSTDPA
jgi:hypothetical protein